MLGTAGWMSQSIAAWPSGPRLAFAELAEGAASLIVCLIAPPSCSPHEAKRNAGPVSPPAPSLPDFASLHPGYKAPVAPRSPHGAKRNAGPVSPPAPPFPDFASLHPGYEAHGHDFLSIHHHILVLDADRERL